MPFATCRSSFSGCLALSLLELRRGSLIICGLDRSCSGERVTKVVIDASVVVEDQARVRCGTPEVVSDFIKRFIKYNRRRLASLQLILIP